jgi:hypothetical protein
MDATQMFHHRRGAGAGEPREVWRNPLPTTQLKMTLLVIILVLDADLKVNVP